MRFMSEKNIELIKAAKKIKQSCNGECLKCVFIKPYERCMFDPFDDRICPAKWQLPAIEMDLNTLEKELLKHYYSRESRYIARGCSDYYVTLYSRPPKRDHDAWKPCGGEFIKLTDFGALFQFVSWNDEPILISDLLRLECK